MSVKLSGIHAKKIMIRPPGAMHHIIVRGINRQKIFENDEDLNNSGGQRIGDNDGIACPPAGSIGNSSW